MKQETAESIVDAYGCAIELSVMDIPESARVKVDGLCDAMRDYLILMLSDEQKQEVNE